MTASFKISTVYDAERDKVIDVLADESVYLGLKGVSWLEPDRIDAINRTDTKLVTVIHYQFVGRISSKAQRFVQADKLSWVEEVTYDLGSGAVRGGVIVDDPGYAKMISTSASGSLTPSGGKTSYVLSGEIKVHGVPLVGGKAEKWLAGMFDKHQHILAEQVTKRLQQ